MSLPSGLPKVRLLVLLAVLATALVAAEVYQARSTPLGKGKFVPVSMFKKSTAAPGTQVSIVRSDDPELPEPTSITGRLSYPQIEAMTRRAVDLAGGFGQLIHPGDRVLIKPNIVSPQSSRFTDVRVVKAVARLVHEAAGGKVEIIIGEGSAFPAGPEMPYTYRFDESPWNRLQPGEPVWQKLWDKAGYQDLLTDPDLQGVNLRLSDLNGPWEDLVQVEIPGGGFADNNAGKVWVHKEVLNADVRIYVPVMHTHSYVGISIGLKDNIGLYPGTRYGFPKKWGVPQDNYQYKLIHLSDPPRNWVDEEIVDMASVAHADFVVVDALKDAESGRENSGVRRNLVVAGSDLVAVDYVSARLMGLNPDDINTITLAAMAGLGTDKAEQIAVVGDSLEACAVRFVKDSASQSVFGQSNRTWLLCGPFAADTIASPVEHPFIPDEADLRPQAGREGWSEPIYFFDDRIDLGAYFNVGSAEKVVAYAFTYFDAPKEQKAELWLGSDEAMRICLNGKVVYNYTGQRAYPNDQLVSEKVPVDLRAGENTLLVKPFQGKGGFDFALNICEPETNPKFAGNRVLGLKFRTPSEDLTAVEEESGLSLPERFELGQNYPNPFNANTVIPYYLPAGTGISAPVDLAIYNLQGQRVRTLVARPTASGRHLSVWDCRDQAGHPLASGIYLYRLQVGEQVSTRKLLLLK